MARPATDSKEKILVAACELIAHNGFHQVTHQEICTRAEVNSALINYYYGSKDKLYEAVWKHSFELISAARFSDLDELPCEEQLRQIIVNRLSAVFDESPNGWFLRIVHHEMNRPTNMGPMLREKFLFPLRSRLLKVLTDYLGPGATAEDAQCGLIGIHGVCVQLNVMRHHKRWLFENGIPKNSENIIDGLLRFAMGGLKQMKADVAARGDGS